MPDDEDRLEAEFAIDRDPAPRRRTDARTDPEARADPGTGTGTDTDADSRTQGQAEDERQRRAAQERIRHQHTWVDLQIRQAMERGEFDRLPGAGKPIEGLGAEHDPEWWLKGLIERERIAVLPASLSLRKEDAELDDLLDTIHVEADARREVEEFNARVIRARYRPAEGPPLITMPRDVDETIDAWRARRTARAEARRAARAAEEPPRDARAGRRRWWPRGRGPAA